jgi:hypothetical protein
VLVGARGIQRRPQVGVALHRRRRVQQTLSQLAVQPARRSNVRNHCAESSGGCVAVSASVSTIPARRASSTAASLSASSTELLRAPGGP